MNPFRTLKHALYWIRVWTVKLFVYPQLRQSDTHYEEYWDQRRGGTLGALSDWQEERKRLVLACIDGVRPTTLVDIGCGDGAFVAALARELGGPRTIGYDFSPRALAAAQENGVSEVIKLDITDPSARESIASGDYLFLLEVLEHLADAEEMLSVSLTRATRAVFFSVPNTGFLTHRFRLLFGRFPVQWVLRPNEHLRFWTYADMKWWIRALGYEHARIMPYRGVPVLRALWPNLFAEGLLVMIPAPANAQTAINTEPQK